MFFLLPFVFLGVMSWIWRVEGLTRVTVKGMSPGLENRAELNHQPAQVSSRSQPGEGGPAYQGSSSLLSCYYAPGAVHSQVALNSHSSFELVSCVVGVSGVHKGFTGNESAEIGWDLLERTRCHAEDSSMG